MDDADRDLDKRGESRWISGRRGWGDRLAALQQRRAGGDGELLEECGHGAYGRKTYALTVPAPGEKRKGSHMPEVKTYVFRER